jgi:hypothetical protein
MTWEGGRAAGVAVATFVVAVFALVAASGVVSAGHGPEEANFTVEPLGDRSPGATNVQYGQTVVATAGVDLETLTKTLAIYEAGGWTGCGPTDASVFGIDRGDTYDGYETDEELTDNVRSFSSGDDRLETEYNGENDLGASTYLDDGDELVSVADCIDNPDDPGWYRITGRTTGVTADGETVTYGGQSHYFWICDCADAAEAREKLGPPPSEPAEMTATPTPTAAPGDEPATPAAEGTGTATTARTDADRTPTPSEADESAPDATRTDRSTRPRTPTTTSSWDDTVYRTPTRNAGGGFGPIAALSAVAAATFVALRRR